MNTNLTYIPKDVNKSQAEQRRQELRTRNMELEKELGEKNQTIETLKQKVEEIAGFQQRIDNAKADFEKKNDELNNKIIILTNANDEQVKIIDGLKEQINKANIQFEEDQKRIKEFEQVKTIDLSDIQRPTACDFEKTLTNLKPLIIEIDAMYVEVDKFRGYLQINCKAINSGIASQTTLKEALEKYDPLFNIKKIEPEINEAETNNNTATEIIINDETLVDKYFSLKTKTEKALTKLLEQINSSKPIVIEENQIQRISAMNYVPLTQMKNNKTNFYRLRSECISAYNNIIVIFDHIHTRYKDIAGHLDTIDHNHQIFVKNLYSHQPIHRGLQTRQIVPGCLFQVIIEEPTNV